MDFAPADVGGVGEAEGVGEGAVVIEDFGDDAVVAVEDAAADDAHLVVEGDGG